MQQMRIFPITLYIITKCVVHTCTIYVATSCCSGTQWYRTHEHKFEIGTSVTSIIEFVTIFPYWKTAAYHVDRHLPILDCDLKTIFRRNCNIGSDRFKVYVLGPSWTHNTMVDNCGYILFGIRAAQKLITKEKHTLGEWDVVKNKKLYFQECCIIWLTKLCITTRKYNHSFHLSHGESKFSWDKIYTNSKETSCTKISISWK